MQAPLEELAYVAIIDPKAQRPDAIGVVDTRSGSKRYGRLVSQVDMPKAGDELHHFGWNACSSHLCPYAPQPHMERRYLIVPGINSSRIHVLDTKPDPRNPKIVKVISGETVAGKSGYAAPHTIHCGEDAIYVSALGAADGGGPGGIFVLDHETFEVKGAWEKDRGPQYLAYDFWWHLGYDTLITSEWGTPNMITTGLQADLLLKEKARWVRRGGLREASAGSPKPAGKPSGSPPGCLPRLARLPQEPCTRLPLALPPPSSRGWEQETTWREVGLPRSGLARPWSPDSARLDAPPSVQAVPRATVHVSGAARSSWKNRR
jgi:hypothetical protein